MEAVIECDGNDTVWLLMRGYSSGYGAGVLCLPDNWGSKGQNAQVGRHDVLAVLAVPVGPQELV